MYSMNFYGMVLAIIEKCTGFCGLLLDWQIIRKTLIILTVVNSLWHGFNDRENIIIGK